MKIRKMAITFKEKMRFSKRIEKLWQNGWERSIGREDLSRRHQEEGSF